MSTLVSIGMVLALRKAYAQSARLIVLEAQVQLERTAAHEQEMAEHRNNALTFWQSAIGEQLAQPVFVNMAAKWLVACEQDLANARLDHSMASQRRRKAGDDHTAAVAKVMATEVMAGELEHLVRKRRDEHQMSLVEDLLLMRRAR